MEDDGLHLNSVGRVHALESHGKEHLAHIGFKADTSEIITKIGIHECLLERRTRQTDKDMFQYMQGQIQIGIRSLGQQPVDRKHALGQPIRGRVALANGLGFGESILQRDAR